MPKIVGQLKAILGLDKKKFDRGLKDAKKQGSRFGSAMKKIGGILAGVFAVTKIFQWAKALKQAYQVQMEAEIKLATIMKQRMGLGKAAVQDLKKQASAYQRIGIIGDEIQLSGLQQLATFLKQKESLDALLPAMNNLLAQQRGFNANAQDAVNIANLMGKVLDGQTSALKRTGISFTDAQLAALKMGDEMERAAVLAEVINSNVGEVNKALGETPLGKIKKWQNAWGDFKEMLGSHIVPLLGKFAVWGMKTLPKIGENFNGMRKRVVALANNFIDLYNESMFFRKAVETLGATFKTLSTIAKGVFDGIILMTKGTGQLLKDIFTGNWKELGANADKVMVDVFNNFKDMGKDVGDHWEKRMENITSKKYIQYIEIRTTGGGGGVVGAEPAKPAFKGQALTAGIPTLEGLVIATVRIAEMNAAMERGAQIAAELAQAQAELGMITVDVFGGMANAISDALGSTENVFKAFWKFFTDFIKGMIIKLVAATIAALALAVVLSMIGLGPGVGKIATSIREMGKFKDIFKKGFLSFGGFNMARGGTVPPGYPNDTFPAMLTSGETVMTPQQMRNFGGSMDITLRTDITRGEDLYWCIEEVKRKRRDNF
jgi:hypothetical protein